MNSDKLLCKKSYAIGYNTVTKNPDWSSHMLTRADVKAKGYSREDISFVEDREVKYANRATLKDYKGSGYDRGHCVPNGDVNHDQRSQNESFYLSNIFPQKASLNRKGWKKMEYVVRGLALRYGKVNIVTGSIYNYGSYSSAKKIGARKVIVPTHFYKVVYSAADKKMWAWLMPNSSVPENKAHQYRVSVDTIEKFANIDLFNQIPIKYQAQMESVIAPLGKKRY